MIASDPNSEKPTFNNWDELIRSAHAWRAQMLQCFAQAETAVSETLLVLAIDKKRGENVRLKHLVGQRFQELRTLVDSDGAFCKDGKSAARDLAAFCEFEELRVFLCHGVAKIAQDRQGKWLVNLKVLSFRSHNEERKLKAFEQDEAEALLKMLQQRGQRLGSSLGTLRKKLTGQT